MPLTNPSSSRPSPIGARQAKDACDRGRHGELRIVELVPAVTVVPAGPRTVSRRKVDLTVAEGLALREHAGGSREEADEFDHPRPIGHPLLIQEGAGG